MKAAIFMVTKECNQECRFCLNKWENKKEMSFSEKKKALDKLKKNGVEILAISGGEPLMYNRIIDLINYAYYTHNFRIIVQTNGTLLNEEMLRKLKGKVMALEVSLEGTEKEHNYLVGKLNFRKVVRNIKLANEIGIKVFTNFTVTKANLGCLTGYLKLLESLDVKVANFTPLYLAGRALENKRLLPSNEEHEKFIKKLSALQDSKVLLNVQPGFKKEMLKDIKNCSPCSIGKEITIIPTGGIRLCPAFDSEWGNVLTSNLDFVDDIKPEDGCLVNSISEAKCTGCSLG